MNLDDLNEHTNYSVIVNGATQTMTEATTEALREVLRRCGVVTFAAIVDGAECADPAGVVDAIAHGQTVELRTYAKPGMN